MLRGFIQSRMASSSTGLALKSVLEEFNRLAPLTLAESWDNVGLLVEPSDPKIVRKILLTNDLTEGVMKEAVKGSADLIYSYHPPVFAPLKRICSSGSWKVQEQTQQDPLLNPTKKSFQERIVVECLENKIAVFSPHTSLDALKGGVNDWLAEAFGMDPS